MNIICGINPVLEALSSGSRHFDRLLVAKGLRNKRVAEAMRLASQHGVALRFETRETLDRMAGDVPHQGLVGVVSAKPVMGLEALLEQARTPGLMVVLDGVEDPRNLGAILRTVEAAGADGVLLPERHSAGLSETVARASAGGLEHVKVARIGNVVQALAALKDRGYWVVGFDAAGSERWDAVDFGRPVVLVLGGEGRGIRRLVREKCDHLASLPLFGHVGSLNVSVVAGIALYEVIRQRRAEPSQVRPIPASLSAAGRAPMDDEPWPEDEGDELREAKQGVVRLDEHDAPAWSAPTVLHNVSSRPRGRHLRDDRRLQRRPRRAGAKGEPGGGREGREGRGSREGREGREVREGREGRETARPEGHPAEKAPREAGAAGGEHAGKKSRRRKGRRRGHPREGGAAGEGGAVAPSDGASFQAHSAPRGEAGADAHPAGAGGEGGPAGGKKGRRRHRRRKRRPGGGNGGPGEGSPGHGGHDGGGAAGSGGGSPGGE